MLHASEQGPASARRSTIKVAYEIDRRGTDRFAAVIALVSEKAIRRWNLRLVLPGARIDSVMWASWRRDGASAVVISGTPPPWQRSGTTEVRVVILGTGRPGRPTGCFVDRARCTFGSTSSRALGSSRA